MKLKEFALFALVAGLLISAFLKCTDSVVNPYHVAPSLELPTDTLRGYVGIAIDSLVVEVKNNVDVEEFGVSPELPKGLFFNAANGTLYGIPEKTANSEYTIHAKNEWGRSKEDVPIVIQIAPAKPGKPVPTSNQTSVTLAWPAVEGAAGYIVYRKGGAEDVFSLLIETDETSITDGNLTAGSVYSYYLVAQTIDSLVSKASDTVEVKVGAETVQHSPTVRITGPADGTSFDLNSEVSITVDAADEDNNLRVVYFIVDGNEHATVKSAPYSAVWTASSGGEHTIKVVAEDAGGLTAEDLITIRVNSDKGIAFTSPSSDTVVGLSETINFAAQTSSEGEEPEQILLSLGDSVLAECESSLCAFEWTAVEGGRHEFTATAHYADGDSVFHKVTVRVNRTPQLTGVVDTTIAENQSLVLQIIGSDPDDDILTLEAANLPNNAVFQPAGDSGTFSWKPGYEQAGEYSVIITVSDGVESVGKSMTITVTEENRPPLFALVGDTTISEKQNFTIGVSASDDDGDEVVLTGTTLPEGATFTDNGDGSGTLSWTPNYGDNGEHQVAITAEDGISTTLLEFTIAVGEVNRAPKFVDLENQSVGEGQQLSFAVTAQDPNGDNMTLKVKSGTSPSGAEFTDNDDGTGLFTWTPGFGTTGNHDVTFVVSDGTESTEKGITISVGDVNRPPELSAVGDTVISENDNLKIDVSASDKDGDGIKLTIENEPSGATFTDNGDGTGIFSWKPGYSDAGEYENIKFIATDDAAESESDVESMTITVNNKDRAPRLENIGDKSVEEDNSLSFQISASDPDGDSVSYSASNLPSGASFNNASGAFSWKPGYDDANTYSVTFTATAGELKDQETITITVENVDRPPVFDSESDKTIDENKEISFTVRATDPDGNAISYSASSLPSGANFSSSQKRFTWTPSFTQSGDYTVVFTATANGKSVDLEVDITVSNVNRAPTLSGNPPTSVGKGNTYTFTVDTDDPDGDNVSLKLLEKPSGMQVSGKTITWNVDWLSNFRVGDQDYTVKVEGKDSHGAADTMIWTVDINEHLWQSKAVNLPADYEILAVLNEDTLYARGSNGWEVHAKFKNAPWTKICDFGNSEDYPMISELVVADRKLFAGGLIDGYDAGVVSFSLSGVAGQTLLSGERLGWYKDFIMNVSPQGDFAAARHRDGGSTYNSAYGVNGDTTITWGMYENGASYPTAVDVSGNRIIVVGRGLTFYSTDGGSSWSTSAQYRLNVALDCNDGDTAYVLDSSSTMNLHRVVFDGNSLSDNYVYSMHEKVQQVKMISGSTGWVVISDELYFTENGFSTKHKENLGIAGLNVDKLFINKNTKRPFVYAGGKIYY